LSLKLLFAKLSALISNQFQYVLAAGAERAADADFAAAPRDEKLRVQLPLDRRLRRPAGRCQPVTTPRGFADPAKAVQALDEVAKGLDSGYGSLHVRWDDVLRLRRGMLDLPGNGALSMLGAIRTVNPGPFMNGKAGGAARLRQLVARGRMLKRTSRVAKCFNQDVPCALPAGLLRDQAVAAGHGDSGIGDWLAQGNRKW